jgi:hypothetical protein
VSNGHDVKDLDVEKDVSSYGFAVLFRYTCSIKQYRQSCLFSSG